jgi:hypothetical protein
MMEPEKNYISGLPQTSVGLMNSEEGRETIHQKPVGLTITVEKLTVFWQTSFRSMFQEDRLGLQGVTGNRESRWGRMNTYVSP